MPDIETTDRYQAAVLWPASGFDAYGQPKIGDPVEISVRWEARRSEALDPEGNTVALDATVVADREIAVGSTMWLGELAEWYGTGSLGDDSEVHQVITYNETPDIRNRAIRRVVGLMRHRDSLPEGAAT